MGAPLTGERKFVWLVLGFAAFRRCACARACARRSPDPRSPFARRRYAPPAASPDLPADPPPSKRRIGAPSTMAASGRRIAPAPAAAPAGDGEQDQSAEQMRDEEDDDDVAARRRWRRMRRGRRALAVPQDGDPVPVIEAAAPQDGLIDLSEPIAPLEGEEDITEADMRSPEDIARIHRRARWHSIRCCSLRVRSTRCSAAAPSRASRSTRSRRSARRIGSFLLFTTIETDVDFNNNIFASPDGRRRHGARGAPGGAAGINLGPPRSRVSRQRRPQLPRPLSRRKTIAPISSKV